ncbi:putative membrane protein [Rhizobium mongolense]|uniref:Membrane protein n=1 Tax=Rhizobium mongolense TaxID=57676 RepID=A0ABR6IWZ5_9HYPH|nr:alpha/beta-hydrolase family protein [Rhizobium mongolense]MBB4232432.1 putative membrane protein [Rhizobium mongolense]
MCGGVCRRKLWHWRDFSQFIGLVVGIVFFAASLTPSLMPRTYVVQGVVSVVCWFPLVTMTQLLLDMATATTSPIGYGHVYAPEHYIDAWIAVTDPQGLSPNDVTRLKIFFENKFRSGAGPAAHG